MTIFLFIITVGDYNIITVDWGKLAQWFDYFGAAARTRYFLVIHIFLIKVEFKKEINS